MTTPRFAYVDTTKPDGFYVRFERQILEDPEASVDDYDCYSEEEIEEFRSGAREFVGVRAIAKCLIVANGIGTYMTFESPGIWAVDGDDDYYNELYREQIEELKHLMAAMQNPTYDVAT